MTDDWCKFLIRWLRWILRKLTKFEKHITKDDMKQDLQPIKDEITRYMTNTRPRSIMESAPDF